MTYTALPMEHGMWLNYVKMIEGMSMRAMELDDTVPTDSDLALQTQRYRRYLRNTQANGRSYIVQVSHAARITIASARLYHRGQKDLADQAIADMGELGFSLEEGVKAAISILNTQIREGGEDFDIEKADLETNFALYPRYLEWKAQHRYDAR